MAGFKSDRDHRLLKTGLSLGIALILCGTFMANARSATQESSCVTCHTNSRELIKLTQVILKKHPPAKSEAIKGEG